MQIDFSNRFRYFQMDDRQRKVSDAAKRQYLRELYAYWGQFPTLAVWEIAALLQGLNPDDLTNIVINDEGDGVDLSREIRIVTSAIKVGDLVVPAPFDGHPNSRTDVDVKTLIPWLHARGDDVLADGLSLPNHVGKFNVMTKADAAGFKSNALPGNGQPSTTAKFSLTRASMISHHISEWPTIEADLKHASENGLSACKAGLRDWHEADAMEWARSKGKLTKKTATAELTHSMHSLPGQIHNMDD